MEFIKKAIEEQIRTGIEKEIDEEVKKFRKILTDRKDQYVGMIIRGISIYHEQLLNGVNYKITFQNINKVEE